MRWFVFIVVGIFLCSGAFAVSGVSPGSYSFDFEPGVVRDFEFRFFFDDGVEAEIYVEGGLSGYVSLSKDSISGTDSVRANLRIPMSIETPGTNVIIVGAREISEAGAGVGISADVRGQIKIDVPYPGRYVELDLNAPSVNAGEIVNFNLKARNRGSAPLAIFPMIQVFEYEISNGTELVETIKLIGKEVAPAETVEFEASMNSLELFPGRYVATALFEYNSGEFARDDAYFGLGEKRLGLVNYSREFERGDIVRFGIEVESFWNDQMQEVFAEVNIVDSEVSFITSSVVVGPWGDSKLVGFLETAGLPLGPARAEIVLNYDNETLVEVVDILIVGSSGHWVYWVGGVVIFILIILAVWFFVSKKVSKKKSKRK